MELCIFVGLQGSGKSTFFQTYFAATHIYISKDVIRRSKTLNKDAKQAKLLEEALQQGLSVVVDNTNPTRENRQALITLGHYYGATVLGYFFQSSIRESLRRNSERVGKARVPDKAIYITSKRLVVPTLEEGFNTLYCVRIEENDRFLVNECTL
jgi:predicted kinase